jgi:hypothetical protein
LALPILTALFAERLGFGAYFVFFSRNEGVGGVIQKRDDLQANNYSYLDCLFFY